METYEKKLLVKKFKQNNLKSQTQGKTCETDYFFNKRLIGIIEYSKGTRGLVLADE